MAAVTSALPTWAAPPVMLQPLSSTSRVMKIGMSSTDRSLIEMSMIAYWTIRARLLRVPGVANVAIWGERLQMLQVQVDPDRMQGAERFARPGHGSHRRTRWTRACCRYSHGRFIGTGGFIDTPNQRIGVRHVLPIVSPGDLAQVTVSAKRTASRCTWATSPAWWRTTSR